MRADFISYYLSAAYRNLGWNIAKHPSYFIIIPVLVALQLITGLQRIHIRNDSEFLLTPDGSRTTKEEKIIGRLFPMDFKSNANLWRLNRRPSIGSLLIEPKNVGSVLQEEVFREIILLDDFVKNISVIIDGEMKTYKDLCAKEYGKCYENTVLTLYSRIKGINSGEDLIKYPKEELPKYNFRFYGATLGGVEVDKDSNIKNAKAVRLFYFLDDDAESKKTSAHAWETAFLDAVAEKDFDHIVIERYTSISQEEELTRLILRILPMLPIAMAFMLVFSAVTCLSKDWIQSKPWTGVIAATSAGLALGSAFGAVMYCDVPLVASVGSTPFLILGIGMDDTFVLLAAWRRTDKKKSVEERLSEAYSESAVSITITSLTNLIAFISGIAAPFPVVRIFCTYASTAVFFSYIFQITFVGGCMAICGHIEYQKRNSLTILPIKESTGNEKWLKRLFCTSDPWTPISGSNQPKVTIWDTIGNYLSLWPVKVLAMIILVSYLSAGFWGISKLGFISEITNAASYDSYFVSYYEKLYKHFYRYRDRIQVVINEELNYADPVIQQNVEEFITRIEDAHYVSDSSLTESWLKSYLRFLNDDGTIGIREQYNMNETKNFIDILRRVFLRHPAAKRFRNDIAFNDDYSAIIGSRFLFQTNITRNMDDLYNGIVEVRNVADNANFNSFVYHYTNFYVDEVDRKVKVTIQILISVAIIIAVVCFVFIPNAATVFSVTFSVVSIEMSVMGYMALWGVELGPVSMMILAMCAGFSVDYAVHFSYVYKTVKCDDPNERMRNALSAIGLAIFQGSVTTILSLLPLAYPIAHTFLVAFKIIFLVILFSFAHGIIFLPVLLSTIDIFLDFVRKYPSTGSQKANLSLTENASFNLGFQSAETASLEDVMNPKHNNNNMISRTVVNKF